MNKYLSASLNNVVSIDFESSWAAKSLQEALELRKYDARFQQKQMQEKEEKLLKLYENQQQRAFERVSRGSAGSNTSGSSTGGGKVRQMFDERRQKAGVDKSYPLEPLKKSNSRGGSMDRKKNAITTSRTIVKATVQKSFSSVRNGKAVANKREVVHSVYNNNDGDESYEERKYEDANADLFNSNSHRGIIEMMNNHNLDDSLDNEEMPKIGFDEVDESYITPKLNRVATKPPSQNGLTKKVVDAKPSLKSNGITPVLKKETNSVVKKPARASPSIKNLSSPARSPRTATPTSPSKNSSATMSKQAPLNTRPSARQSAKSTVVRDDLAECNFCGRRFATDRLQKHEDICSKTGKKKRKVYDATKHRVIGTELETYVLKGMKGKPSMSSKPSSKYDVASRSMTAKSKQSTGKKDWRRTHEEFIAAIRAAKQAQAHLASGGKLSDLPPPPPSSNPDYVQCPHCGRRFNESAAERHIPKCATYEFNKPKAGAGKQAVRR